MSDTHTIVAEHTGGLRITATVRGHRVETDQPISAGGEDAAAMPLELLGAALATCGALYAQQFCAARNLSAEGLRVEVDTETARNPKRISRFDLRVFVPSGLSAEHATALERAVRSCPALNTLLLPTEVELHMIPVGGEVAV